MRVLAIGDIHGCSRAFDRLLEIVDPAPSDLIITLGDYVHRGPDSPGVLDRLIALHQTGRLIALCGNHEQMLLDSPHEDPVKLTPDQHQFLMERLVDWYEIDTHFFVHANAYPNVPFADQPTYMLRWESLVDPSRHESGKIMVCGHTPQTSGVPMNLGHTICIDTFAYGGGWLSCLDVRSGQYWQTNQKARIRTGWIDELRED